MTLCPLLRRIGSVAAFKPFYNGQLAAFRELRTSTVNWSKKPPGHDFIVTYEQLKAMLASRNVQLFDIRKVDEFRAGHIPSAVNIPLEKLEESLKLPPEQFERHFMVKPPKKEDGNIVFHCQRGRRSLTALEITWGLGFSRARHYAGGYSEWAEKEKQDS